WTELIPRSADKQFRLYAIAQKIKRIHARLFSAGTHRSRWNSHTNQCFHPRIPRRRAQPNRRTKRESSKDQREMILGIEPVESGANIFHLSPAHVMLAMAESSAAKVEAQHG